VLSLLIFNLKMLGILGSFLKSTTIRLSNVSNPEILTYFFYLSVLLIVYKIAVSISKAE